MYNAYRQLGIEILSFSSVPSQPLASSSSSSFLLCLLGESLLHSKEEVFENARDKPRRYHSPP